MTCRKDTKFGDAVLRRLRNADFHGVSSDVKVMHSQLVVRGLPVKTSLTKR